MIESSGLVLGYGLMLVPGLALVAVLMAAGAVVAGVQWAWRRVGLPSLGHRTERGVVWDAQRQQYVRKQYVRTPQTARR
jgi:hypothetical protein